MKGSARRDQLAEIHGRGVGLERTSGGSADPVLTAEKQRLIVQRASAVLFENGFHRTSIRDIAAACDMSMGQLYHYISSKDDILYLMHKHMQEKWQQNLEEAGFQDVVDPLVKLERGLRVSMTFLSNNRDLLQFLYTETKYLDREHLQQALELDDRNVVGFYRQLLSQIPAVKEQGRQAELAANLMAFIGAFLALRGWNLHIKDERDVDEAVDFLIDFVFGGLGISRAVHDDRE